MSGLKSSCITTILPDCKAVWISLIVAAFSIQDPKTSINSLGAAAAWVEGLTIIRQNNANRTSIDLLVANGMT
jgi:hypothetical protein